VVVDADSCSCDAELYAHGGHPTCQADSLIKLTGNHVDSLDLRNRSICTGKQSWVDG
jgi:hypothetical protein